MEAKSKKKTPLEWMNKRVLCDDYIYVNCDVCNVERERERERTRKRKWMMCK
jgi:hypothetical protein